MMKNPFKRLRTKAEKAQNPSKPAPEPIMQAEPDAPAIEELPVDPISKAEKGAGKPDDGFTEWCRSRVRGGIERRERNDIYEAYSVFGVDEAGRLVCRYYHRYPEHERDYDLSYSRELSFDEFNRRMLSELDKGDLKLSEYHDAIGRAAALSGRVSDGEDGGLSEDEAAVVRAFCDEMDNLIDKEYYHGEGDLRCSCVSVVGDERLQLWFRKPLSYDALGADVAGVSRTETYGYDIDNLWIMGVYNRLRERCDTCRITLLTSQWSVKGEAVYLMEAEGFSGVSGTLLLAVGQADSFYRFGFYSLDFTRR